MAKPKPGKAPAPESARVRALVYAFPLAVFALVVLAYVALGPLPLARLASKAAATTAVIVIAFTYLLGSIYRFVHAIEPFLSHRKYLGLAGFAFALAHVALAFNAFEWSLGPVLGSVALQYGAAAFVIFLAVALTSNKIAIEKMGYGNWRNFQRLGYLALLATILHFAYVGRGQYLSHPLGGFVLAVALVAILARFAALFAGAPRAKPHHAVELKRR